MFGDDRVQARDRYLGFVEYGLVTSASLLCDLNASALRVVGDDRFAANALQAAWMPKSRKTFRDVVAEVCA
jgi:hypothetical protein